MSSDMKVPAEIGRFKLLYKGYTIWSNIEETEYIVFDGGLEHHLDTIARAKQLIDFLQVHYSVVEKTNQNHL